MRWILPALALVAVLLALLTFVSAPDSMFIWKLAIMAGEFGHWLVLLPLGLVVVAFWGPAGASRVVTLGFCGLAVIGFLRPAFSAWRIGRTLGEGAFSFARLYVHPSPASVTPHTEVFARPAGQELKLDFYPAKPVAGKLPGCVVVIHGGGWDSGERTQLDGWNARLVAQGYAVAAISYRLAPQFVWPAQRDDIMAAIAWLKTNAPRLAIDPTRFVLLGRSAGGQLATAIGYGARDPAIRAVIALYAPHDMPFAWSVSREDDALNSIKLFRQYFSGPPDTPERLAHYEEASGQLLARQDSPPTLLIHGRLDTLAWYRHSERLTIRLQELGVPHTHLQLPWATHGFDFNAHGPAGQLADYEIARYLANAAK